MFVCLPVPLPNSQARQLIPLGGCVCICTSKAYDAICHHHQWHETTVSVNALLKWSSVFLKKRAILFFKFTCVCLILCICVWLELLLLVDSKFMFIVLAKVKLCVCVCVWQAFWRDCSSNSLSPTHFPLCLSVINKRLLYWLFLWDASLGARWFQLSCHTVHYWFLQYLLVIGDPVMLSPYYPSHTNSIWSTSAWAQWHCSVSVVNLLFVFFEAKRLFAALVSTSLELIHSTWLWIEFDLRTWTFTVYSVVMRHRTTWTSCRTLSRSIDCVYLTATRLFSFANCDHMCACSARCSPSPPQSAIYHRSHCISCAQSIDYSSLCPPCHWPVLCISSAALYFDSQVTVRSLPWQHCTIHAHSCNYDHVFLCPADAHRRIQCRQSYCARGRCFYWHLPSLCGDFIRHFPLVASTTVDLTASFTATWRFASSSQCDHVNWNVTHLNVLLIGYIWLCLLCSK